MAKEHNTKFKKLFILFVLALNADKRLYQEYEGCCILCKEGTIITLLLAGHPTPAPTNPKLNSDCHRRLIIFFQRIWQFPACTITFNGKKKGLKVYGKA